MKHSFFGLLLMCSIAMQASAAVQDSLLRFIRAVEVHAHHSAYDAPYDKFPIKPPKPLTQMTIAEVLAFQKAPQKTISTAMGAYQIIHETLSIITKKYNIPHSAKFDKDMQDHLARLLIAQCSDARQKGNVVFGNCLAGIWAALPMLSGPNSGQSKYKDIAGNKARTTPAAFLSVLNGSKAMVNLSSNAARAPLQSSNQVNLRKDLHNRITIGSIKSLTKKEYAPSVHTLTYDPYQLE